MYKSTFAEGLFALACMAQLKANPVPFSKNIQGHEICDKNKITVWYNSTTQCLNCVKCQRGLGAAHACGDVLKHYVNQSDIICVRCKKRQTFSTKRSVDICKPCKVCKTGQKIEKYCTRRLDTVCGGAKKGYYKKIHDIGITTYEKCSRCCGDRKDKRIDECERQAGLPTNQVCSPLDEKRCPHRLTTTQETLTTPNLTTTRPQASTIKPPKRIKKVIGQKIGIGNISQLNRIHFSTPSALPQKAQRNAEKSDIDLHYIIIIPLLVVILLAPMAFKLRRVCSKKTSLKQSNRSGGGDIELDEQQAKPSVTVVEFLADPDANKNSKYNEICRIMNDFRPPKYQEHFNAIGNELGIEDPVEVELIRTSKAGAFQLMLVVLELTKNPPTTLEMVAKAVEKRGYDTVAALLRKEDERLLNSKPPGHRDQVDEENSPALPSERRLVVETSRTTSSQQSPSVTISDLLGDENNLKTAKWERICGLLNDQRRPQHKEHLTAIGKDLGVEPEKVNKLYDSHQVERFEAILEVVNIIKPDPPVTLEAIALAVERRGYKPAAELLRKEDERLLNAEKEHDDSAEVAEDPTEVTPLTTAHRCAKTGEEFGPLVAHPVRGNVVSR